nr:hypothetical protein [Halorubrum sp. PV6]
MPLTRLKTDLAKPQHLDEDRRVLIGDTRQKARGHGVGGDAEIGAEVAKRDIDEIRRVFDDVEIHEVDAALVAAGLGDGTGSGAAPVVMEGLQKMYDEPVYRLGVLPSTYRDGRPGLNAARSLQSFVTKVTTSSHSITTRDALTVRQSNRATRT